jgi:hypothetical protein
MRHTASAHDGCRPADTGGRAGRVHGGDHDMTDLTPTDSTDAQTDAGAQQPADTNNSSGPQGLLKGAAGALLGLAGISAATGSASASGTSKRLLVIGDGKGQHTYEIQMESGGQIQKATHAGGNDSITSSNGGQQASGELWHWNVDSYTFSGEIDHLEADGSVAFHFLDGAFQADSWIGITGQSPGRHQYVIGSNSADIDLGPWSTEYVDSDDGPPSSEQSHTPDHVSGAVRDSNYDGYDIAYSAPIQHITVEDGHLRFE